LKGIIVNATQLAKAAYSGGVRPVRTPRGTEYEAFARVTSRLKAAYPSTPATFSEMVMALHDNRRLWILLAADVADADNKLPMELRGRILSLAEFTRRYSSSVLQSGAPVTPLIEINTAIMRGLDEGARPK
jgi:flagellar protein FlaF